MRNLTKTQVATYLTKSDKLLDEVCDSVYKVTCNPSVPESKKLEDWNYIRDILVGVIHQQAGTKLIAAETLFVQAKLIQDAEGDIVDTKKLDQQSDIKVTVYDKTMLNRNCVMASCLHYPPGLKAVRDICLSCIQNRNTVAKADHDYYDKVTEDSAIGKLSIK